MNKKKLLLNYLRYKTSQRAPVIKWWQAGLFLAAVTVLGRISSISSKQAPDELYEDEIKPRWSPPAWAFGPAWMLNNILLVWGARRLLSTRRHFPYRRSLLTLQGIHWLDFITFGFVYFRLKSPILALIWTQGDAIVAGRSLYLSIMSTDRKLPIAYVPLTLWTTFASSLAWLQALYNPDPLLGTKAPLKVSSTLENKLMEKA